MTNKRKRSGRAPLDVGFKAKPRRPTTEVYFSEKEEFSLEVLYLAEVVAV